MVQILAPLHGHCRCGCAAQAPGGGVSHYPPPTWLSFLSCFRMKSGCCPRGPLWWWSGWAWGSPPVSGAKRGLTVAKEMQVWGMPGLEGPPSPPPSQGLLSHGSEAAQEGGGAQLLP